jgi:hypothetical protein
MRLSSVLSNFESDLYEIESFINNEKYTNENDLDEEKKTIRRGSILELNVGKVVLDFYNTLLKDYVTYSTDSTIHCLVVNKELISIDCVFNDIDTDTNCSDSSSSVQAWFLVQVDDIFSNNPKVRIIKRSFRLPDNIKLTYEIDNKKYDKLLFKAEIAYKEGLGAGAIIYLRTVFEKLTEQIASDLNENIYNSNGYRKPFKKILTTVDNAYSIIPIEFKEKGYDLFGKLSEIAHGNSDEEIALQQYQALRRLVIGIMENIERKKLEIKNSNELKEALKKIGFDDGGELNG